MTLMTAADCAMEDGVIRNIIYHHGRDGFISTFSIANDRGVFYVIGIGDRLGQRRFSELTRCARRSDAVRCITALQRGRPLPTTGRVIP